MGIFWCSQRTDVNTLLIPYSTVVYVDIRPRGPTFDASIKNYSVVQHGLNLCIRYTYNSAYVIRLLCISFS